MRVLVFAAVVFLVVLNLVWSGEDALDSGPAEIPTAITAQAGELAPAFTVAATTSTSTITPQGVASTVAPTARTAPMSVSRRETVIDEGTWDRLADCESGDWDAHAHPIPGTARWDDRRAGYEGGIHFAPSTWVRAGGRRFAAHAYLATRLEQIEIAVDWLSRTSWAQWPKCSRMIGVR